MDDYIELKASDLFEAVSGKAKYTKDYVDSHKGSHPVYSASLAQAFGHIDEFDFDGHYLTWVMNGYGGRVQEMHGRFSTNRDRGVFIPRDCVLVPDLTYLRFALEPQLTASAVGRRVDGRRNEYTKIYPEEASAIVVRLPADSSGDLDYAKMARLGEKFRRIELAQSRLRDSIDLLERARFSVGITGQVATLTLGDPEYFTLSIGERVLRNEFSDEGVPVYSANALVPFGNIKTSNLTSFERPSLLWGIDGNFDWNLVGAREVFATTDHCGRLQITNDRLDPEYVWVYLQATRSRYGFDRVFRASLRNIKNVVVEVPLDMSGKEFSPEAQRKIAQSIRRQEVARTELLTALEDVSKVRMSQGSFD